MSTVIKGTKTIEEYNQTKQHIEELAELAYQRHKEFVETWEDGKPVKARFYDGCEVCVTYESGKQWCYMDLELPFPTWWLEEG